MHPRCWAEIDLEALRHNAATCRSAGRDGTAIMAIVKADAYGHGLPAVAGALADVVEHFGVANLTEARELVGALDSKNSARRVLILSPLLPEERSEAVEEGFAVAVSNEQEVAAYVEAAKESGRRARLHAAADTGMGRMGAPATEFSRLIASIRSAGNSVLLEGVASHFPSADEETEYTWEQIDRFRKLISELNLDSEVRIHLANSAGLLGFGKEIEFATESRPGLALYGVSPLPEYQSSLRPVLTWKTRVTLVREVKKGDSISYGRTFIATRSMRTATLAAGYGDGYPRSLSGNSAEILIAGIRCPLLGRVTMDQVVVDVSALPDPPHPGDEAILLGSANEECISATELAAKAGTIPWEIFTGITGRVVRLYR